MKRIFVCALTLLMAVSMLFMSACGGEETKTKVSKSSATTVTTTVCNEDSTAATTQKDAVAESTTVPSSSSNTTTVAGESTTTATRTEPVLTKPTQTGTSAPKPADPTTAFLAEFEGWLLNLTEYTTPTPKTVKVTDGTITVYTMTGAKNMADYCVHVHSGADKSIRAVYVTAVEKDYDFMFAVFSYYVYQSLGLTKLDADAFLEQFENFPNSIELSHKAEADYRMSCVKPDEFLTFAVTGKSLSVSVESVRTQLLNAQCSGCYEDEERALNYLTLTDKGEELGLDISILDRALLNAGNRARLADVMKRAKNGEDITIAYIGGSVTEGAYASDYSKTSYAGLTFAWWKKTFTKANFTYLNAGVGGTSSLFGVHRVEDALLKHEPDFVIVEFAVNDCDDPYQTEAYANLVHRILNDDSQPAVMLLCVMNENGKNNQDLQIPVGKHYDLPMISYRDAIWPEVKSGKYLWAEIGADYVHPTDFGHSIIAELVISYLTKTYQELSTISDKAPTYTKSYMPYVYENATYYHKNNITPTAVSGFSAVNTKNTSWKGSAGSAITFTFTGKRCILAIPTTYKDDIDITVRIDGKEVSLSGYLFHGGAFANMLVFDADKTAQHTIEIVCNSGTAYIGGLFIS